MAPWTCLFWALLCTIGFGKAIEDVWLGLHVRSMKETGAGLDYCKIPKTGSTVINFILCDVIREYHGISYAQNISETLDGHFPCFAENNFKKFNNGVRKWKIPRKIKFAVVRDPIDRFISMYGHFCLLLDECEGRNVHEFAQKVHDALIGRASFVNNQYGMKLHILPQADFCDLGVNLEQYELIYYSEDRQKMKQQFDELFEKSGMPEDVAQKVLRHLSESSTTHALKDKDKKSELKTEILENPRTLRVVRAIYYADYLVFNFK